MIKKTIIFSVAILLFTGCKKETADFTDVPIIVRPDVTTRAGDTYFDPGDEIGLTITANTKNGIADNYPMSYNGTHFHGDDLTWYDKNTRADFFAYYPYQRTYSTTFSVKTGQNNQGQKHYTKSDLMLARATNVEPNVEGVTLTFSHVMSLLIITVKNESEAGIENLFINNTIITANVDYVNKIVKVKDGEPYFSITALTISQDAFRALIVPQETRVEIGISTDAGKTALSELPLKRYEQGKKYFIEVTLDKEQDITEIEIVGTSDIQDWEPGEVIKPK